jgi:hypothetical protein
MIKTKQKFIFKGEKGKNLIAEINFRPKKPKDILIKIKDEFVVINSKDVYNLAIATSSDDALDELIPIKHLELTEYMRQHTVVAQKDIKKGEHVVVNCKVKVPDVIRKDLEFMLNK